MVVAVHDTAGIDVVALSGEIDLQTSPQVREAVLGSLKKGRPVVVDMGAIDYIDSSGVASLVEGFQMARKQGLPFLLCAISPAALRVLSLARLDRIFPIHDSLETALGAARAGRGGA